METCPCCHRRMPVARAESAGAKKFAEDQTKAQSAVDVLSRHLGGSLYPENNGGPQSAMACERLRMLRALREPRLLWSIYRRSDKKGPINYGMLPAAAPIPVETQELVAA